ncbi:flavin reductase [Nocardiopsis gilva YIM 90087]|uniref:Flavin reductase n=1 Tax=Nocardiopsis gilva YIM 90087 TaxID=1235441 RepID=A0A223S3X6_9ACTN|nr:flavin reductase family protein [Nocardiopsis gilva]ASU82818.1 flavin reductase [Nocardiopsis gilva YIM 90087]
MTTVHTMPARATPGQRTRASAQAPEVDADAFRRLLAHHAAGVVIVTADVSGEPVGLTATSFTSVSQSPPLVAFYIADSSTTWPDLRKARLFAVHLLAEDQRHLAARFAARDVDRFAPPTAWCRGAEDVPLLDGTAVHMVCRRYDSRLIGDHWLVVGEVERGYVLSDPRPPLLYHRGAFGGFAPLA